MIHHFTCRSLTVGCWRRIGQNAMDLVVFYSPEKACMTYYINNDSAGYKIEYPFSHIKNITLESGDQAPQPNGAPPRPGGLVVELNRPPLFYMDSSNSGGFYQCGDFTEEQQATQILVHHLGGHPKVLSVQLAKLVSLESFQNRMAYNNFAMPAPPMSPPFIQRPASQPNHFAAAAPFMGLYQEPHNNSSHHLPNSHHAANLSAHPARGHKRQRSRSVPVAVDFSALQTPMSSYTMPQTPHYSHAADSGLYAPIPQSAHSLAMNLRVDTSSSPYGMDPRGPPMSAATTASPPEFASPSYLTSAAGESTPVATNMGPPFHMPFMSPVVESSQITSQSTSPYSNVGTADPLIANHSPPLSNMPHTSTTEMYGFGHDNQSSLADDGMAFGEMYSKQNVNYSVPTTVPLEGGNFEMPIHSLSGHSSPGVHGDYKNMGSLGNVDANSMASGS